MKAAETVQYLNGFTSTSLSRDTILNNNLQYNVGAYYDGGVDFEKLAIVVIYIHIIT